MTHPKEPAVGSETPVRRYAVTKGFENDNGDFVKLADYRTLERALSECRRELAEANRSVDELNEVLRQAGWGQGEIDSAYEMLHKAESRLASLAESEGAKREGFYEKLWKDFISLQRGNARGICEKVERYYREHPSPAPDSLKAALKRRQVGEQIIEIDESGKVHDPLAPDSQAEGLAELIRLLDQRYQDMGDTLARKAADELRSRSGRT